MEHLSSFKLTPRARSAVREAADMRRILIIAASLLMLASPAKAVDSTVSGMIAASALGGTELLYCVQGAADRKCTPIQLAAYLFGTVSGDLTCAAGGACTLKNTGPGALGPIGSATVTPIITIDAQGRITALTSASITQPAGANPTATAGPAAVNGAAATFMRSDAAPLIQQGSASQKGIVQVDGTTITATGGVISAVGGGAVSSVTGGCGLTISPTTGAVVASANATARNNTTTSDTLVTGDCGALVTESNASPVAVGVAQAGSAGFLTGFYTTVKNKGAGLVTITPTTSTIDGAANLTLTQNQSVDIVSDGTNYFTLPGRSTGGTTNTIASGTAALGTGAIASATCATVVTSTATGTATTDVLTASFNGDPTAVTGYIPATAGMLTIFAYPTANAANFKVCNNTNASVTPGAVTLNWRVVR
jgi:hypothetical protein